MRSGPHLLRPEELSHVLNLILEKNKDRLQDKNAEQNLIDELSEMLRHTLPSSKNGRSIEPHILHTIKLMLTLAIQNKKNKNPNSKVDIQLIADMLQKILHSKNPELQLAIFSKVMMKAIEENNNGKNIDLELVCKLALKGIEDKEQLTPEEKRSLKEIMMQIVIYSESGVPVDVLEGMFSPGSKAAMKLTSILALEGKDAIEIALEEMEIIHPSHGDIKAPSPNKR